MTIAARHDSKMKVIFRVIKDNQTIFATEYYHLAEEFCWAFTGSGQDELKISKVWVCK